MTSSTKKWLWWGGGIALAAVAIGWWQLQQIKITSFDPPGGRGP